MTDENDMTDDLFVEEDEPDSPDDGSSAAERNAGGEPDDFDGAEDTGPVGQVGATPEVSEGGVAGESQTARLERELNEANEELIQVQDRLVRKAADLENARRRHQREKDEVVRFAAESLLKDLVPVLDDLERALDHVRTADNAETSVLIDGVEMVARKFSSVLQRRGVVQVSALNEPFDPQFHEAIQQRDDDSVPHNTVVQEFQRGYMLHDRLIRPALVVVAQGGPKRQEAPTASADDDAPDLDGADVSAEPSDDEGHGDERSNDTQH